MSGGESKSESESESERGYQSGNVQCVHSAALISHWYFFLFFFFPPRCFSPPPTTPRNRAAGSQCAAALFRKNNRSFLNCRTPLETARDSQGGLAESAMDERKRTRSRCAAKTERGASIVSLVFAMCLCLGAHFGFVCDARELCVKTDSLGALLDGLAFPECVDHFVLAGFAPGILTATAALLACLETRRHCKCRFSGFVAMVPCL
jgi:hypothetical protein